MHKTTSLFLPHSTSTFIINHLTSLRSKRRKINEIKNNINRPFQSKLLYDSWLKNSVYKHITENCKQHFETNIFLQHLATIQKKHTKNFEIQTRDKGPSCQGPSLHYINFYKSWITISPINHVLSFFFTTKQKWIKLMKKLSYKLQIKFDLRVSWLNLSWFLIPFFS